MAPAAIPIIAAVAGTAVTALGQQRQAGATAQSEEFQANVLDQQANRARQQANLDAKEFLRDQQRTLGTSRAARAASGVDPNVGSAQLVDDDLVTEIALQTAKIREGGQVTATRAEQEAAMRRASARSARTGGLLSGGGTLISGLGRTFGG